MASAKRKFRIIDATSVSPAPFPTIESLTDRELDVLRQVKLKRGDPGAMIRYASDDDIHTCLGLQHSPVPQGASAAASASAFKAWVVTQFHAEHDNAEVEPGSGTFHRLNFAEFMLVQNRYVSE